MRNLLRVIVPLVAFYYYVVTSTALSGVMPILHPMQAEFTKEMLQAVNISDQIFLVTGANSGIGLGIVQHLLQSGAGTIIVTCRSQEKADSLIKELGPLNFARTKLIGVELKLDSLKSVKAAIEQVKKATSSLNVLIANAGVINPGFLLTEDGIESTFQTNHLGHHYFIRELIPLMKPTQYPPRIVIVASDQHKHSQNPFPLALESVNNVSAFSASVSYGTSKLGNILEANHLSTLHPNILINSANPGFTQANLTRRLNEVYGETATNIAVNYVFPLIQYKTEDGALSILSAAFSPKLLSENITGRFWVPIGRLTTFSQTAQALDPVLAKKAYEFSENLLKERGF